MDKNIENGSSRMSTVRLSGYGTIIVLFFSGIFGYWYLQLFSTEPAYTHEKTPFDVLMSHNSAFAQAEALFGTRQYRQAIEKYNEALPFADDSVQTAQIQYKIALSYENAGEYAEALHRYKELAIGENVYRFVRAYAAERIGQMYYTYYDQSDYVFAETFKDEPFKAFAAEGDPILAYRRLFEYGSSFYPLGMSQARIANWYAGEALRMRKASSSPDVVTEYLGKVRQSLANADADIGRIKGNKNERRLISGILSQKGEVLLRLAWMKEVDPKLAEEAYTQAVRIADATSGNMGFERFHLASFLERYYGEKRANDIRATLEPFYRDWSRYANTPLAAFFRFQRNTDTWMHNSLADMGKIDPEFKKLLITLGWVEGDFM